MDLNRDRKKPILFKGFSQPKEKSVQCQEKTPLLPTIKIQRFRKVPELGSNLFFSNRLFSNSMSNMMLTNGSGNFTTYMINGRILRGPLRNLLDNGDSFKDSYFQACLIPENYPSFDTKKPTDLIDKTLKLKQKEYINNNKDYLGRKPAFLALNSGATSLNKNLSDYLSIRTCRSANFK